MDTFHQNYYLSDLPVEGRSEIVTFSSTNRQPTTSMVVCSEDSLGLIRNRRSRMAGRMSLSYRVSAHGERGNQTSSLLAGTLAYLRIKRRSIIINR